LGLLCSGIRADTITYIPGGSDTSSGALIAIIGILLIAALFLGLMFYGMHSYLQRTNNRYNQELERLDRQFKDGQISEETYRELKRDIERKYKWIT
jgi:uncharacterized membrane protein